MRLSIIIHGSPGRGSLELWSDGDRIGSIVREWSATSVDSGMMNLMLWAGRGVDLQVWSIQGRARAQTFVESPSALSGTH